QPRNSLRLQLIVGMDAEEIQRKLTQLSRANFRNVVALILRRVLDFDAIDVDAAGDGGSDWKVFEDRGQRLRIAIQDTTQASWSRRSLMMRKRRRMSSGGIAFCFLRIGRTNKLRRCNWQTRSAARLPCLVTYSLHAIS